MPLSAPAPIYNSNQVNPDEGFSFANQTTAGEAFRLSLANGVTSSLNGLVNLGNTLYAKHISPGKTYTKKEWENSQWFREGLSFDNLVGDNNTASQYVAELAARNKDEKEAFEARLENMKPGFLNSASKITGDTIGFLLDPASIAGGGLAFKAAKILKNAKYIRAGLDSATRSAQLATEVGIGAAEGLTAIAPPALVDYVSQQQLGDDTAALRLIANLGLGIGLGGAVRGIFGVERVVHPEADVSATQTAASQLQSGKAVRVDEVIKDGLYRKGVTEAKAGAATRAVDNLDTKVAGDIEETLGRDVRTAISDRIHTQEKAIQEDIVRTKTRTVSSELRKPTKAPEILKRLEQVNKIEKFELTADQKVFLNNSFKTEELKRAKDILAKPGHQRGADEISFLNRLSREGGEEALLAERLENQRLKINEIEAKLKSAETKAESRNLLNKELKVTRASRELGQERLAKIETGFDDPVLAKKHQELAKVKRLQQDIDELVTSQDILDRLANMDKPPVTPDELLNAGNAVRSFKNSASYSEREIGALEDDLRGAPKDEEKVLSDAEKEFEDLSSQELTQEERDFIDDVNAQTEQIENLSATIPDVINCMLR